MERNNVEVVENLILDKVISRQMFSLKDLVRDLTAKGVYAPTADEISDVLWDLYNDGCIFPYTHSTVGFGGTCADVWHRKGAIVNDYVVANGGTYKVPGAPAPPVYQGKVTITW